jgi:hypothetical protein
MRDADNVAAAHLVGIVFRRCVDESPGNLRIVILFHRIGSRSPIARGLMKGARRPIRREKSATKESIILGGLGATIPDGENAPKIRADLALPRKYPLKSAP